MLPRPDYDRLLAEYVSDKPYRIVNNDIDPDYPLPYAVVNDTRTIKIEKKLRRRCTRTLCVNIDVFPLDCVPGDLEEAARFYRKIGIFWTRLNCVTNRPGRGRTVFSTIYRNLGILLYRMLEGLGLISIRKAVRSSMDLAQSYNPGPSGRLGITSDFYYGLRDSHPSAVYEGWTDYQFEGHALKGILHAPEYLSGLYGPDYMELPPPERRITHHTSTCYWKV